ncbi:MAG: hypothetical protein ACOX6C_00660 [Patescibacteria group bacterium]|jgi:hypothetical protein
MVTFIIIVLALCAAFILMPFSLCRILSLKIFYSKGKILLNLEPKPGSPTAWIKRLTDGGYSLSAAARDVFMAATEEASSELMGVTILKHKNCCLQEVRELARQKGLFPATVETAALLRENISDRDLSIMKLDRLIIMHPVFTDRYGTKHLLCICNKEHSFAHKAIDTFIVKENVTIFTDRTAYVFLSPQSEKECLSLGDIILQDA